MTKQNSNNGFHISAYISVCREKSIFICANIKKYIHFPFVHKICDFDTSDTMCVFYMLIYLQIQDRTKAYNGFFN